MSDYVEIAFDCLPLRSIQRFDVPLDASPEFREFCHRVIAAARKHGLYNTYYLHNARCVYHLTNDEDLGVVQFQFEGTILTDPTDQKTLGSDLGVTLDKETCDWLTAPVVAWFADTVSYAVRVEFDRYIASGDLERTIHRIEQLQKESDSQGGFLGMGI